MALRYRDIAVKTAHSVLAEVELSPVDLGETFNDGTFLTNKQLDKVQKHFDKVVGRLKKQVDKIDDRTKTKKTKSKKTKTASVKEGKKKGKKKGKK